MLLALSLSYLTAEEMAGLLIFFSIIFGSIGIVIFVGYLLYRRVAVREKTRRQAILLFPDSVSSQILTGLTPVEAGIIMNVDLSQLLTMYLLDLASFGDIRIISHVDLKFAVLAQGEVPAFRKLFFDAIKDDGTIDVDKAIRPLDYVYNDLKKKIRDYDLKATAEYYYSKVDRLWQELKEDDPGEEKLEELEELFSWLFLHDNVDGLLEDKFKYSGFWPKIAPLGNMQRVISQKLIKNQDLLKHLARYPDGLLSAPYYKNEIITWAKGIIRHYDTVPSIGEIEASYRSRKASYGAMKYYTKMNKLAQEAKNLLEVVENTDTN